MGIFSGLFRSRDKPKDSYDSPSYSYFFGRTHAGKRVNDRTAMQIIAVYACVRVLSEAIAQLPLHVYQYTDSGKERVPKHPLYFLLHDQPNPEMTSFVFRETLMAHLLIYGNAYAQIIRNGRGDVVGLYPLMPDKTFEDRQVLYHTKTLGIIEIEPTIWKSLTLDEKMSILQVCDEKLEAYYSHLNA